MFIYLVIAAGGALGSMARYFLTNVFTEHYGSGFPWGTLAINVTGSFAIGFFATLSAEYESGPLASPAARHFFMTGICGGYTTFSSFSLQTLYLARDGAWIRAGGNVAGSITACLAAVWLGHVAAVWMRGFRT